MGFLCEGPLGDSIEDYEVGQFLGQGGFATVHRAVYKPTKMEVAIKMIDISTMKSSNMIERVREEVNIHYRLKHPSILELYNFFQDQNYIYLVLEYCRHGEIGKFLRTHNRTTLTEPEALTVFEQVLQGVLYLHKYNIVHRDLTLSNILLTEHNRVKIADFGLAMELIDPMERHVTMCGTPNYIAPEVATKSPHGPMVDVWSLGVMLYTLLVGKPPFDTPGIRTTLNKVVKEQCQIPDNLSGEAKDLLSKLLCKDPVLRIRLHEIQRHPFMQKHPETHLSCNSALLADSGFSSIQLCSRCEASHEEKSTNRAVKDISLFSSCNKSAQLRSIHKSSYDQRKPPQISTKRLQPLRNVGQNLVFHILNTGHVCMEFLQTSTNFVKGCFRISPCGNQVWVYPVQKPLKDKPPDLPNCGANHYFYADLPMALWGKYNTAYNAVEKVKANTVKVTIFSKFAVFRLMETSPVDFHAEFYAGITFRKNGDSVRVCSSNSSFDSLFNKLSECEFVEKHIIDQFLEGFQKCLDVEKSLTELSTSCDLFPANLGSRPVSQSKTVPSKQICSTSSIENRSVDHNTSAMSLPCRLSNNRAQSTPIRKPSSKIWVEGIGEITTIGRKLIRLSCLDGSQVIHEPTSARVTFRDALGKEQTYSMTSPNYNQNIPPHVLAKLRLLKNALQPEIEDSPTPRLFLR